MTIAARHAASLLLLRQGGPSTWQLLSHLYTATVEKHHLRGEVKDASCSFLGWDATSVNVGDKVSVRVGAPGLRSICNVRRQTLGSY